MGQEFKYQAIVLGKREVGETDRLYILYTREKGKLAILGKGVRKPNAKLAGTLETLNLAEVFVSQGKGRGNITGAIGLNFFPGIRANGEILQSIFKNFTILEKFISEEEKDETIFELLLEYLETLEQNHLSISQDQIRFLSLGFIIKLLDVAGYRLEVRRCVACGNSLKQERNFFSFPQGGIICESCSGNETQKVFVDANAIKILRIFLDNKMANFCKVKITEKDLAHLENIVQGFLAWTS